MREEVARLLERQGLPRTLRRARRRQSCSTTWPATRSAAARSRNLVLLRAPGDVAIESEADEAALVEAIEELRA